MNVESYLSEGTRLEVTRAVLLYSDATRMLATVHDVMRVGDIPTLLPGECLTQEALERTLRSLSNAPTVRDILPPEVLCDTSCLCWWKTATRLPIFFNTKDEKFNKEMSGAVVLHPPLVFLATSGRLRIFALTEDCRPKAETLLYRAPYYNLYGEGAMCAGNVRLPEVTLPGDIPMWEKAFFDTNFTHPNIGKVLTRHEGGHDALWSEARHWDYYTVESPRTAHTQHLMPLKMTLQEAVNE